MPNHVTNIVTVSGDEATIRELVSFVTMDDEGGANPFNFDAIIPMPEGLMVDAMSGAGGLADTEIKKLAGANVPKDETIAFHEVHATTKNDHETVALAHQMVENIQEHGHASWYGWSIQNWGTKWNSYSNEEWVVDGNTASIQFETAWSTPMPVFGALSKKFPGLDIMVEYADENIGSNCGVIACKGGECEVEYKSGDDEFACRINGYDYEECMQDQLEYEAEQREQAEYEEEQAEQAE